ncbi:MAG: hypothetical protein OXC46_04470 [Thaumarchaeota archaeon]|nr:hypothetical protein [Nitrososphaerota archaeon]
MKQSELLGAHKTGFDMLEYLDVIGSTGMLGIYQKTRISVRNFLMCFETCLVS